MITGSECINKTDEQIIVLTLKNQDYYLCLMKRYEAKLLNYILKISNINREDAEDILQEVFVKAYQNLNDFDLNFLTGYTALLIMLLLVLLERKKYAHKQFPGKIKI